MTAESSHCPTPEVIAAFVAGNLSGTELSMTAEHLRLCPDCREIAAEAARVDREGVPSEEKAKTGRPASPWWWTIAAAALAGLAFLAYQALPPARGAKTEIRLLIAAAPRDGRDVEARLAGGFVWAPLRGQRRAGDAAMDPGRMKLIGAAGEVLQRTGTDSSAEGRHAAAVAHLLAGDAKQANDVLSATATERSDAGVWNDLAAARYTASLESGNSAQLTEALAAADAAIRKDPKHPEALFNRALIIERLGLRDQARAAWQRYLLVDPDSPWAREARAHLQALAPETGFREELQNTYDLLQKDWAAAQRLAERYPQEARVWGETEILGRWAESVMRKDNARADAHLRVARAFAETVARRGDVMFMRAVEAIDRAGPSERKLLADAHLQFRAGQRTYRDGQPAAAEYLFARAQRGFEAGRSPLASAAAYFRANTIYDQGRVSESREILEMLSAAAPREFPSHRAQLAWQLGLVQASLGHWGDSIRTLNASLTSFEQLGELGYANAVRNILAEVYDRLGERRAAWNQRIVALRAIGRSDKQRVSVALDAAARGAAINRDWPVTISLLGLHLEVLQNDGDEFMYAETLLDRARIQARMGAPAAASKDLQQASDVIRRMKDPTTRARVDADRRAVEALLAPPGAALAPLTNAIEFHRGRGRRMYLPELFLQRGRARAAAGQSREAAEDFENGIRELRAQRESAGEGWGTFAVADELFDEAIGTAMRRGDANAAFAYAERSRSHNGAPAPVEKPVADSRTEGQVVVEYATLPDRTVIFVVDRGRIHAVTRDIGRAALMARADKMIGAAMANDLPQFRKASNELYAHLVQPVATQIAPFREWVFVPDATLSTIPFAALMGGDGAYIIEQHSVVVTPSYAWYVALKSHHEQQRARELRSLVIEGPSTSEGERAWFGRREADAVAAEYRLVEVLPPGSGRAEFEKRAAKSNVIHFVGHAIMPNASDDAALVTSRESGTQGRLEAEEIAVMHLPQTNAVVLAACGTARGRQVPGETRISVARAFLSAGVPSVVATLWPIDDGAAAEFFPRLHSLLARGRSPADALRVTQLEWIQRPDAQPGMWAAVQIIGI